LSIVGRKLQHNSEDTVAAFGSGEGVSDSVALPLVIRTLEVKVDQPGRAGTLPEAIKCK
jgi:hypothetical protein